MELERNTRIYFPSIGYRVKIWKEYLDTVVRSRPAWQDLYEACRGNVSIEE